MKLIKLLISATFILLIFTLAACGSDEQIPEEIDEEINETISFDAEALSFTFVRPNLHLRLESYAAETQIDNRRYLFTINDEYANTNFIYHAEELIHEIRNIITLSEEHMSGDIHYFTDKGHNTLGRLLNTLSGNRLPLWFSAGIEAVARYNLGSFDLIPADFDTNDIPEDFGDLSFLPLLWDTDEHRHAVNTSFNFVLFLIENELLDELVTLYLTGDVHAEENAQMFFQNFAGKPMSDLGFVLEFRSIGEGYYIKNNLVWGNVVYIFDMFEQFVPVDTMQYQMNHIDRASEFVYNWYSQYFEFDFLPITHLIYSTEEVTSEFGFGDPALGLATFLGNYISYAGNFSHFLYIIPHEISHIVEFWIGELAFAPFSEGLAHLMEDYFNGTDVFEYVVSGTAHQLAHYLFASGEYVNISDINSSYVDTRSNIFYYPEISSRISATSFVQYLIETYGAEKYFQVHWRIQNFENVYGITIEEMFLRWREFLEEYVASS